MSSYGQVVKQLAQDRQQATRTGYRCAAHGCLNAGAFDDRPGIDNSGKCYAHWQEPDVTKWPAITERVRARWHNPIGAGGSRNFDTDAQRQAESDRLRAELAGVPRRTDQHPKAWAHRLQRADENGDPLTPTQRAMWNAAGTSSPTLILDAARAGLDIPTDAITNALVASGDIGDDNWHLVERDG